MRPVHGTVFQGVGIKGATMFNQRLIRYFLKRPQMAYPMLRVAAGAKIYALRYFDRRQVVSGPPITVIIRITHRCNARCIQCGQWGAHGVLKGLEKKELERELSTEQLKSFIDKIAPFSPFISFFGGEPSLRDDIVELVSYVTRKNLLTTMNSNCLLLKEKAEGLIKGGLTYYKASLDGPEGINESIRLAPNSYRAAEEGIRHLIDLRRTLNSPTPIVQMCSTVTKENQYHLLEIAKIADSLGVDILAILFGIFTTPELLSETNNIFRKEFGMESKYWPGFVLERTGMDIKAIRDQIREIKRRKWCFAYRQYPADTKVFDIDAHYNLPRQAHGKGLCIVPWFRMQVMPNGDIALCEDTPDYVAGNILQEDPLAIWNGEKYRELRNYILTHGIFPVCTRCSALYEIPHYRNDFSPSLTV